jgi:transcriptional/translational regulatory protein YebC/TACO1
VSVGFHFVAESRDDKRKIVSRPDKESEQERVWSSLVEAGFLDIPPEKFAERIKEAKHVVITRLSELLQVANDIGERESAACSIATLKKLETTVERKGNQRSSD